MLTAAIIVYLLVAILGGGPGWPLALLAGKAGPLGYLLVIGWIILLIGGMTS